MFYHVSLTLPCLWFVKSESEKLLSRVGLFATPWTVAAHQDPLCPWNSPGKNTGMGSHSLLQGIFLMEGSNPGLLYCRQILYCLSHQGSPILCNVACQLPPFMRLSRQEYWSGFPCLPPVDLLDPEIEPVSLRSPALAGGFFTTSIIWEALGSPV